MANQISRRTMLASVPAAAFALGTASAASAQETAYSAFRVVRETPGEPAAPEITLPDGYTFVSGTRYHVASRAEYYTFVHGPVNPDGIEVKVRWPNTPVKAVVHMDQRLRLRRRGFDDDTFTIRLPVTRPTVNSLQGTIQVWSHPTIEPGYYWRIEHNDPDRVAGPFSTVPWPAGAVRSVVHQLFAFNAIWRDSGMLATAAAKGHRWVLMGFETNNTLHPDNPPHWHMAYNSGADFGSPTHNPHFWINGEGRNYYNGMDVTGMGRLRHYVGDPAAIYDFVGDANDGRGNLAATVTIREDGGLDVDPPDGPRYSMTAGPDGTLREAVDIVRDGKPWLRVATNDYVKHGVLVAEIKKLREPRMGGVDVVVQRYDRLTGVLK